MPIPTDFPFANYDRIRVLVNEHEAKIPGPQPSELQKQFARSHNTILWRFRAVVGADEAFQSLLKSGRADDDRRYDDERTLFEFFSAFVSCIEVTCYCSHAIGAIADPAFFPMGTESERRRVDPKPTLNRFRTRFPIESVTAALQALIDGYDDANTMRNHLSHRGSPPRSMFRYLGGPGDDRDEWGPYHLAMD